MRQSTMKTKKTFDENDVDKLLKEASGFKIIK